MGCPALQANQWGYDFKSVNGELESKKPALKCSQNKTCCSVIHSVMTGTPLEE